MKHEMQNQIIMKSPEKKKQQRRSFCNVILNVVAKY
jgi:hypothetical protein